jgi:hypothetical protein
MDETVLSQLHQDHPPFLEFANHHDWCTALGLMQEAAEEIERLRQQIRQLEAERDQWQRRAVSNG